MGSRRARSNGAVHEHPVDRRLPDARASTGHRWVERRLVLGRGRATDGTYTFRASIVEASDTDPNPANNASAITIVVNESVAPPPPPPPAPVVVSASTVRLSAAKPKAGSPVTASVRVTAGGAPIRPSKVACGGTVAGAKLAGKPRAAVGRAMCTYRPPKTAKGKRLRGAISFTARGKRFTKRFSATLR